MREKTGTVNPFASRKQIIKVMPAFDDKIQGFQPAIGPGIPEIDHLNTIGFNVMDQIILRKVVGWFLQKTDQWIGSQINRGFFHNVFFRS
jgi:hypothetical protein